MISCTHYSTLAVLWWYNHHHFHIHIYVLFHPSVQLYSFTLLAVNLTHHSLSVSRLLSYGTKPWCRLMVTQLKTLIILSSTALISWFHYLICCLFHFHIGLSQSGVKWFRGLFHDGQPNDHSITLASYHSFFRNQDWRSRIHYMLGKLTTLSTRLAARIWGEMKIEIPSKCQHSSIHQQNRPENQISLPPHFETFLPFTYSSLNISFHSSILVLLLRILPYIAHLSGGVPHSKTCYC